jgi:hypothetical protein
VGGGFGRDVKLGTHCQIASNKEDILPKFTRPLILADQIIILDGLTGTGKTMFSPLIASFEGVQNPRFEYMFEYLAISGLFNKADVDTTSALLKLLVDIKYYDAGISREVNFRPTDLSSVFSNGNGFKYLRQLFQADGGDAANRLKKESPTFFLVTHQLLSCMNVMNEAFGERLKVVEMVRHPLYLLDHWLSYIDMHGTNPRDFTVWIDFKGNAIPWFAAGWEEKYLSSTSVDRVIYSIDALMQEVYDCVANKKISNVLFIPFEKFVLHPDPYLNDLENFFGMQCTPDTKKHLKKQLVPRENINIGPQKKIYIRYGVKKHTEKLSHKEDYAERLNKAENLCSPDSFAALQKCISKYEEIFGVWY